MGKYIGIQHEALEVVFNPWSPILNAAKVNWLKFELLNLISYPGSRVSQHDQGNEAPLRPYGGIPLLVALVLAQLELTERLPAFEFVELDVDETVLVVESQEEKHVACDPESLEDRMLVLTLEALEAGVHILLFLSVHRFLSRQLPVEFLCDSLLNEVG
jgi:hypothetical protein